MHVVLPHLQSSESEPPARMHKKGVESISSYDSPSVNITLSIIPADGKSSPKENINSSLATTYCAAFSKDLRRCLCNVRRRDIEVRTYNALSPNDIMDRNGREMSHGPSDTHSKPRGDTTRDHREEYRSTSNAPCTSHSAVTLITATTLKSYRSGTLDLMLESWCGPKVRVLTDW